jgi:hypothetical protein
MNAVVTPAVEFFRQKHYRELQQLDKTNRVDYLKKYDAKQESVSKLIYRNYGYKAKSEIYDKIVRDASRIWT